jgi:biotin synthase-like enzyme
MNPDILKKAQDYYALPLMDLIYEAHEVHRQHHDPGKIQKCSLLSIKTGGCPEDCSYCPQSAHYETGLERQGPLARRRKTGPNVFVWVRLGDRLKTDRISTASWT